MKILFISDLITLNSGVAIQTRQLINRLLEKDKNLEIFALGVLTKVEDENQYYKWSETKSKNLKMAIMPSYEDVFFVKKTCYDFNIDKVFIITDPRFYFKFFYEFNLNIPIIYWHVWDNYPYPYFNKNLYFSCDDIMCLSKLTYNCVNEVVDKFSNVYPNKPNIYYVPHFLAKEEFYHMNRKDENLINLKKQNNINDSTTVFLFNSVNMNRKNLIQLIEAFSVFSKNKDVLLIIKTVQTVAGFNIGEALDYFKCDKTKVIDNGFMNTNFMSLLYNIADFTINISYNEGFGLSILESLQCGTPVLINMTGGLQDQLMIHDIIDQNDSYILTMGGIGIYPTYKKLTASHAANWIYEDYISNELIINGLEKLYSLKKNGYFTDDIKDKISTRTAEIFNIDKYIDNIYNIIINSKYHEGKHFINKLDKNCFYSLSGKETK